MDVFESVESVRECVAAWRSEALRIGLVPTMGALHEGHRSLVREAKSKCDKVIASIFLNPKQFGPDEDLERYPKTLDSDKACLVEEGCDALFLPTAQLMYPKGFQTTVSVPQVSAGLCGAHREGHFDGVATVVLKLFNIVAPDTAFLGEKDFQQLVLIRTMARDLNLQVQIQGCPIVRDEDGLALSSRNRFLDSRERKKALAIAAGLRLAKASEKTGADELSAAARKAMEAAGLRVEYVELRRGIDLSPLNKVEPGARLLAAAWAGQTRLIDNVAM